MGAIKQKIELYVILLNIPHKMLTDNEINIAYYLSKDEDIKNHLQEQINREKVIRYLKKGSIHP